MPRIQLPAREDLSPDGQATYDEIAGPRGGAAAGPFSVWLLTPEIARGANALGNALRLDGTLDRDVFELVTLACAAYWDSEYPWAIHKHEGLAAGLTPDEIKAISDDEPEKLTGQKRAVAYAISRGILVDHDVSHNLFHEGLVLFGEQGMIEITTIVGFYSTASIVAKVFNVDVPALDNEGS